MICELDVKSCSLTPCGIFKFVIDVYKLCSSVFNPGPVTNFARGVPQMDYDVNGEL